MLRNQIIVSSPVYKKYYKSIDRVSAYEIIKENKDKLAQEKLSEMERQEEEKRLLAEAKEKEKQAKEIEKERQRQEKELEKAKKQAKSKTTAVDRVTNSAMNTIGREIGRSLMRGVLGSLKR